MKFILSLLLLSSHVLAVYGVDSRKDFFELENEEHKTLMKSMSYAVYMDELKGWTFNRYWKIVSRSFKDRGYCSDQKFAEQKSMRNGCSAVLVGEDLLLTAGNCTTDHYCNNDLFYWVFDYHQETNQYPDKIRGKKFFKCDKLLKRVFDPKESISLTLMKLKKKVKGRKIIKLSQKKILDEKEELMVLGNIDGLTTKFSDGAYAIEQDEKLMIINSDIAGESVGSGVFNKKTLELEGILIYGTRNYVEKQRSCKEENRFEDIEGRELVIKSNYLYEFIKEFL